MRGPGRSLWSAGACSRYRPPGAFDSGGKPPHSIGFALSTAGPATLAALHDGARREAVEKLCAAIRQLPKTDAALGLLYLDSLSYRPFLKPPPRLKPNVIPALQ